MITEYIGWSVTDVGISVCLIHKSLRIQCPSSEAGRTYKLIILLFTAKVNKHSERWLH